MGRRTGIFVIIALAVLGISVHAATEHNATTECVLCALCPFC